MTEKILSLLFAFGHGLSYTNFEYSNLRAVPPKNESSVAAELEVINKGKLYGKEIVQGYIRVKESNIERPIKELKKFEKIGLEPGELKKIKFELSERDLYLTERKRPMLESGASGIYI